MKLNEMKVLVTGGAGFIGSHLVDALVAEGCSVLILDNFTSGKKENLIQHKENNNVNVIEGDIRDRTLLKEIMREVDIVYHLAVQCLRISIKNPGINHAVNATGTLNVCMDALDSKVKRFVYVSSSEVYGTAVTVPMSELHPIEPITVYGASKAAGELYSLAYHKTYGLQSMVIRPFNTYGPRSHFEGAYGEVIPKFVLKLLNNQPPVILGNGTQTRDFTYISDTVKGIIMASQCDEMIGRAVNIARGEEVSINSLASLIAQRLNKDIKPLYMDSRPGDVIRHYADISKARELFGYSAEVDKKTGIEKYIEWFTEQGLDYTALLKQDKIRNWE